MREKKVIHSNNSFFTILQYLILVHSGEIKHHMLEHIALEVSLILHTRGRELFEAQIILKFFTYCV